MNLPTPSVEYGLLSPMLIVFGAAIAGVLVVRMKTEDEDPMSAMTRGQLRSFHVRRYVPERMVLAVPPEREREVLDLFAGEDVDVIEIDGASHTGVDNIRELRSNAAYSPAHSRLKIYIIDEVHMLSPSAFNALLKTLEEPPGHVKFIFATTVPHKVIETVQSRCQRFDFRNISAADIVKRLQQIAELEGIDADPKALSIIARRARGGMRDSQSLLDQLIAYDAEKVSVESVQKVLGRSLDEETFELLEIIDRRDPGAALALVERLSSGGESIVEFMGQFLEQLRNLMVLVAADADELLRDLPTEQVSRLKTFKEKFTLQSILYMISVLSEAMRRTRTSPQRRMLAELALVKLATMENMSSLSELLRRLESLGPMPATSAPMPAAPAPTPAASTPAQASTSVPAPAAAPTPTPVVDSDNPISAAWGRILEQLRDAGKRRLAAFMLEGVIQGFNDGELVLGFSSEFSFHRRQLEELESRKTVEEVMSEVVGQPVRLRLVETDSVGARTGAEETSQAVGRSETGSRTDKPADKSSETPLVRKATELFRGSVINTE